MGYISYLSYGLQERCLKAKVSRKEVKYPHKTGSRYYLAQTYAVVRWTNFHGHFVEFTS